MRSLNPADLIKMTAYEVANLADIDVYAVRDEGFRRQTVVEKKLMKLQKQMAAAMIEMAQAQEIITAAFKEQNRK